MRVGNSVGPTDYPTESNIIDDVNNKVDSHELRNTYTKAGSLTNDPSIVDIKMTNDADEGTSAEHMTSVNRTRSCVGKSYDDVLKSNIVENKNSAALNKVPMAALSRNNPIVN